MTKKVTIASNKLCTVLEFILNNIRFSKQNGTDDSFDINKVAPMAKKAVQNYKKVMKLAVMLLFFAAQSFGQTPVVKELKYSLDSGKVAFKAAYEMGSMDIELTYGKPDTTLPVRSDTVFTAMVIRIQSNTNSALMMTKTKFIVRKIVNGELLFTLYDPTGKKIFDNVKLFSYEGEYKTWIIL